MGFLFFIPSVRKWSWKWTLGCDKFVALTSHRTSLIMVVFSCYLVLVMSILSSSTTLCLILLFPRYFENVHVLPIRICLTMTTIVVARPCCYSSFTKNCLGIFITLSKIQRNWWDFHKQVSFHSWPLGFLTTPSFFIFPPSLVKWLYN